MDEENLQLAEERATSGARRGESGRHSLHFRHQNPVEEPQSKPAKKGESNFGNLEKRESDRKLKRTSVTKMKLRFFLNSEMADRSATDSLLQSSMAKIPNDSESEIFRFENGKCGFWVRFWRQALPFDFLFFQLIFVIFYSKKN